jgi:hypothetical protein
VATYERPETQGRRVSAIVTNLVRCGFQPADIVVLSMRGLTKSRFHFASPALPTMIGLYLAA